MTFRARDRRKAGATLGRRATPNKLPKIANFSRYLVPKRHVNLRELNRLGICQFYLAESRFPEVPMAGLEPARALSAQRILSPLRLPFRHIGVAACILRFFEDGRNGFCMENTLWQGLKEGLSNV